MGHKYAEIAFTEQVKAIQRAMGSRSAYSRRETGQVSNDKLGPGDAAFIAGRALILDGRSQIDPPARSVARQGLVAVMLRAKDRPLARCVLRSVRHEREIVSKYGRI